MMMLDVVGIIAGVFVVYQAAEIGACGLGLVGVVLVVLSAALLVSPPAHAAAMPARTCQAWTCPPSVHQLAPTPVPAPHLATWVPVPVTGGR